MAVLDVKITGEHDNMISEQNKILSYFTKFKDKQVNEELVVQISPENIAKEKEEAKIRAKKAKEFKKKYGVDTKYFPFM